MPTVELALSNSAYANVLRAALTRNGNYQVNPCQIPNVMTKGVLVVDDQALDSLPRPLPYPERVVLITRNDPQHLARAWDAGIVSVVFEDEPPGTAVLAVMAASLRTTKALPLRH
ncbi:MAG: hypothetical protein HYR60_08670 [Acidobacteria bacterium]|nr:hypothetical protein [Acidobacteriota bacterium]MBI3470325.1 hypothetical protein [Candidatus Solibacter usitatus]